MKTLPLPRAFLWTVLSVVALVPISSKAQSARPSGTADEESPVVLSPFEISAEKDHGYGATRTMSGTRLNSRIEDLASSISIVTKQQLLDTAAVDINDIFLYEGNTEGTYQFTDFEIVNGGASGDIFVDKTGTNPSSANRIRGLGAANISINGFESTAGIPVDSYNLDSAEISRGPNSNIFGLGNPSGTINLLTGQANANKRTARVKFQGDSYGGFRTEGQYNIPIKQDVLGIGIAGVYQNKGLKRKPSYDRTGRETLSVFFRPFRKTTVRAWYENYQNVNSLPNSITPRDLVSQWVQAGRPTWNPITGRLTTPSGVSAPTTWGDRARLFQPGSGVNIYSDSFITRLNQFIDQSKSVYFSSGYIPPALTANSTTVPGPITPSVSNSQLGYYLESGTVFDRVQQTLWKPAGVSDKSIYDWENVNMGGANYGNLDAHTASASIEQIILQSAEQTLAVQGAFFNQYAEGWNRNFVGSSGGIASSVAIDINEKLLDGSPNPYFLRPFMSGSEPQVTRTIDDSKTYRAQLAYRLDLTNRSSWLKWIGVQSLAAYGETRDRKSGSLGYRSYILPGHSWLTELNPDGTARAKVSNAYRITYRYYLGDNQGNNIDYAPSRLSAGPAQYNLYWNNAKTGQWTNESVAIQELFDANRIKREQRYTSGIVWQANLIKDMVVPTLGYRYDRLTEYEGPSRTFDPNGFPDISGLWNLEDPAIAYSKNYGHGPTRTAGVVVKPLKWFHLFYNQSSSFRPAGLAYDVKGNILPNPSGTGKDYGVALYLLKGKLVVKYNQYETREENARTTGSSATNTSRLQRIDFDINRASNALPDSTDRWHLEASAYRWVLSAHQVVDRTALSAEQVAAYRKEAWDKYLAPAGLPFSYREWFMGGPTKVFADTNTATGRGKEIEINYNPDNYLSLKATITQEKSFDSAVSISNTEWMNERLEFWKSVTIPSDLTRYDAASNQWVPDTALAGKPWWTTWDANAVTTTNQTPEKWFQDNVEAQMALVNGKAGQRKPQTREWRVNTVGRYRLAGISSNSVLRKMVVGGSVRWEDRGAVGYLADTTLLNSAGQYYRYDVNKPVFDSSHYYFDFMTSYEFSLLSNKVNCSLQLNVKNVFESGGLRVVGVNPDGAARDFRIIDPRQIILSANFDF